KHHRRMGPHRVEEHSRRHGWRVGHLWDVDDDQLHALADLRRGETEPTFVSMRSREGRTNIAPTFRIVKNMSRTSSFMRGNKISSRGTGFASDRSSGWPMRRTERRRAVIDEKTGEEAPG